MNTEISRPTKFPPKPKSRDSDIWEHGKSL